MKLEISPFDAADYLKTDEEIREFLQAAIEEGPAEYFPRALNTAARAKRRLEKASTGHEIPCTDLEDEDPPFTTVMQATRALGFNLAVVQAGQ